MNESVTSCFMAEIEDRCGKRTNGLLSRRRIVVAALILLSSASAWADEVDAAGWNPAVQYGKLVDSRDGQEYRTVKIGKE